MEDLIKGELDWHNKVNENFHEVDSQMAEKVNKSNKPTYKSASVSISGDSTYDNYQTDILYEHLEYQGAAMTLVPMVNIASVNDSNPIMMDDSKVINCINKALSHNVKTIMLKPHLGVNWSDGFNRKDYAPSNYDTFFANWKTILLYYAEMCNTYNIPILCLGCEQEQTTINAYSNYWEDIYNSIKGVYPNLLLTYACNQVEWMRNDSAIFANVDLIGFNVYLQWSSISYNDTMTYDDIIPSFYTTYDVLSDGIHLIDRINYLSKLYSKQVFITEIGIIPIADGLITLLPPDYNNSSQYNYNIYAIVLEALMNVIRVNDFIKGLAIWHSFGIFSYWTDDTSKPGYHVAEEIVKKYFKEVL